MDLVNGLGLRVLPHATLRNPLVAPQVKDVLKYKLETQRYLSLFDDFTDAIEVQVSQGLKKEIAEYIKQYIQTHKSREKTNALCGWTHLCFLYIQVLPSGGDEQS